MKVSEEFRSSPGDATENAFKTDGTKWHNINCEIVI